MWEVQRSIWKESRQGTWDKRKTGRSKKWLIWTWDFLRYLEL